jgi:hypothetical protein
VPKAQTTQIGEVENAHHVLLTQPPHNIKSGEQPSLSETITLVSTVVTVVEISTPIIFVRGRFFQHCDTKYQMVELYA